MSRKPDYALAALNKRTDERANIGAAWINKDGSIGIVLDAFVVLHSSRDLVLNLFPRKRDKEDTYES